jgi:hypothetical protein
VHGHQLQGVVTHAGLVFAGFQRGVGEEGFEGFFFRLFTEQRGGVDQFVLVAMPVLFGSLYASYQAIFAVWADEVVSADTQP